MQAFIKAFAIIGLFIFAGCGQSMNTGQIKSQVGKLTPVSLQKTVRLDTSMDYLLYLPPDYEKQSQWPLILFLHGSGERGNDLELVKKHGIPKRIANGDHFPFIVVSPQCPSDNRWILMLEDLKALLDDVKERYKVDKNRVYLTGLSMGGQGAWLFACKYPRHFAAVAPVCGVSERFSAFRLVNPDVPVWAFHGEDDEVIPVSESVLMVKTINDGGGLAKLTIYPGIKHNSWDKAYNDPKLYQWLLEHKLESEDSLQ